VGIKKGSRIYRMAETQEKLLSNRNQYIVDIMWHQTAKKRRIQREGGKKKKGRRPRGSGAYNM
jgi:hypothetical protein